MTPLHPLASLSDFLCHKTRGNKGKKIGNNIKLWCRVNSGNDIVVYQNNRRGFPKVVKFSLINLIRIILFSFWSFLLQLAREFCYPFKVSTRWGWLVFRRFCRFWSVSGNEYSSFQLDCPDETHCRHMNGLIRQIGVQWIVSQNAFWTPQTMGGSNHMHMVMKEGKTTAYSVQLCHK